MPADRRILVLRFSAMGDVVMISAALRCMRIQLPTAHIHLVTHERYHPVIPVYLIDDHTLIKNKDYSSAKSSLQSQQWNYIIDFQNTLRSFRFCLGLKGKVLRTPKYHLRYWLHFTFRVDSLPAELIALRHIDTLRSLGVEYDGQGLSLPKQYTAKAHSTKQPRHIAIVLGGTYPTKRIPISLAIDIAMSAPEDHFVLVGGDDIIMPDKALPANCKNHVGQKSIAGSINVLSTCQLIITGDTGLMHIGTPLRIPLIVVWGSTAPQLGFAPLLAKGDTRIRYVQNNNLTCRPCNKYGATKCPLEHMHCLSSISTNDIKKAMEELLSTN